MKFAVENRIVSAETNYHLTTSDLIVLGRPSDNFHWVEPANDPNISWLCLRSQRRGHGVERRYLPFIMALSQLLVRLRPVWCIACTANQRGTSRLVRAH